MSREIKFRAWHPGDQRFIPQWVKIFGLVPTPTGLNISFSGEVHPERNHPNIAKQHQRATESNVPLGALKLSQYTGLHDKNGVEIYEGDIVAKKRGHGEMLTNMPVLFEKGAFRYGLTIPTVMSNPLIYDTEQVEAAGSIYENPELLKSGEAAE